MEELLFFSFVAGACTLLGAVLLFIKRQWSNSSLGLFLGLASGVMLAVVVFDMLPSAFLGGWKGSCLGIILGITGMGIFDQYCFRRIAAEKTMLGLGYLIILGMALHDLPEGMAIAMGNEMKSTTGMLITLAIGIHNIPEGMAVAAPLIIAGLSRLRIMLRLAILALVTPLGTLLGIIFLNNLPGLMNGILGFASGIMTYLVVFHLWPQAGQQGQQSRWYGFGIGVLIILLANFI